MKGDKSCQTYLKEVMLEMIFQKMILLPFHTMARKDILEDILGVLVKTLTKEIIDFLAREAELRKQGISEVERAKSLGLVKPNGEGDTTRLRAKKALATSEVRKAEMAEVLKRRDAGMSYAAIAEELGIPSTTVRSLCDQEKAARNAKLTDTADTLKDVVGKKKFVDVGKGINESLDVTEDKLKKSL